MSSHLYSTSMPLVSTPSAAHSVLVFRLAVCTQQELHTFRICPWCYDCWPIFTHTHMHAVLSKIDPSSGPGQNAIRCRLAPLVPAIQVKVSSM